MEQLTGAIGVAFYLFLGYVFIASQIEFFGEHLARSKTAGKEKTGGLLAVMGGLSIVLPLLLSVGFGPMLAHPPHYRHPGDSYSFGMLSSVFS
jgi:hypothetical protein